MQDRGEKGMENSEYHTKRGRAGKGVEASLDGRKRARHQLAIAQTRGQYWQVDGDGRRLEGRSANRERRVDQGWAISCRHRGMVLSLELRWKQKEGVEEMRVRLIQGVAKSWGGRSNEPPLNKMGFRQDRAGRGGGRKLI